jgi:pyruvate carboxylase
MPGGQYTNFKEQAEAMGLGHRWHEIAQTYRDVNMAFGDIVKVTPSSKVVGDLALFLVSHDMTVRELEKLGPDHSVNIPASVIDMLMGSLGEPEGGWPERMQQIILRGQKPQTGRPGENLPQVDLAETTQVVEKKVGRKVTRDEVLSYLMYPDVFVKFSKARQAYGPVDALPTPQFYYAMERGSEIPVEIEAGKTLSIKFLTVGEPHPDGTRTVFFELNGQPREISVRDRQLLVRVESRPKADPNLPGQVGAPIPGVVSSLAASVGDVVSKGDRLLVMEAMKMQTTVYAPIAGKVTQLPVAVGDKVEAKDLLAVIE